MVPLSVFYHYAYTFRPYLISKCARATEGTGQAPERYHGGFLGVHAWARALNPWETIKAIVFAFTMAAAGYQRSHNGENHALSDEYRY